MAISAWLLVAVLQACIFTFIFLSQHIDQGLPGNDLGLSIPYTLSKAACIALHVNLVVLVLTPCQSLQWVIRNTVGRLTKLGDHSRIYHFVLFYLLLLALIHAGCQWAMLAQLSFQHNLGAKGFALFSFAAGVGWSGHTALIVLGLLVAIAASRSKTSWLPHIARCEKSFQALFFVLWAAHEAFYVPSWTSNTFTTGSDVFWYFWIAGAVLYAVERVSLFGMRTTQKAQIIKILQHPNAVFEFQFEKLRLKPTAGQHILLSCPTVSLTESRKLPLTSAPEEAFLSVHMHASDHFYQNLTSTGCCNVSQKQRTTNISGENKGTFDIVNPSTLKSLPQLYVCGPFGGAPNFVFDSEVAVFVGVGESVTVFASIIKSIWYRMHHTREKFALRKVYFFWICHDFEKFEWFRALLMAIELQDMDSQIEIYPYLTAPIDEADATKHLINSAVHGLDIVTGLRTPTRRGHPYWDEIFADIAQINGPGKVSVLYSGPRNLGDGLETECKVASGRGAGGFSFSVHEEGDWM